MDMANCEAVFIPISVIAPHTTSRHEGIIIKAGQNLEATDAAYVLTLAQGALIEEANPDEDEGEMKNAILEKVAEKMGDAADDEFDTMAQKLADETLAQIFALHFDVPDDVLNSSEPYSRFYDKQWASSSHVLHEGPVQSPAQDQSFERGLDAGARGICPLASRQRERVQPPNDHRGFSTLLEQPDCTDWPSVKLVALYNTLDDRWELKEDHVVKFIEQVQLSNPDLAAKLVHMNPSDVQASEGSAGTRGRAASAEYSKCRFSRPAVPRIHFEREVAEQIVVEEPACVEPSSLRMLTALTCGLALADWAPSGTPLVFEPRSTGCTLC
ncbi:hypothetical protein AURDEDRAFT_131545 [Auricularia subglabra TFB-10046 SS5]|uniref:Uncharacterized protein n=1 Tax=Auricularia subglabra (strain TFB-10046 / SS5) TaxID=717982 RepID=J0WMW6_AURST|nr:hypothetical protein AURDEDRAFT_131545 [Auricularia subglabra TFB-10046 SS5]